MTDKTIRGGLAFVLAAAVLTACSPQNMETPPVVVQTAQGPVTCQLYTHSEVYWDRSTDRPDSMSVKAADDVCRAEGYRLLHTGQ